MAKKFTIKKLWVFIVWLASILAALAVGGFFIAGGFMNTFLGILPILVHQIIGWILILSTVLGIFWKLAGLIK